MATTENGTYYPSDYSSVADVPGDMKKMAESIDANKVQKIKGKGLSTNDFTNEYKQKLEDLENYDDTEVKKDISDIKEEQETQNTNIENLQENDTTQDELIEKLQQENKNIKSALINVETEQAKSLHIEDASTVSSKLEVEGNAEQETREGYNLLDINKGVISSDCTMTQISKSEYKITVNNNADWARIDIPISLLSTKTYRASIYTKVSNANARIEIGTYKDNTQYGSKLSNNSTDYKKQIIDNIKTNINRFVIWLNPDSVSEEFEVYIKELMLYEGSEEKEYEPYGAMPSVNYPSKIKCLGSNKNYFNKDTVTQDKYLTYQNQEVSNSAWTFSDYIECKPNEQWIISGYTAIGGAPSRCFYDANKNHLSGGAHNNQESMMKFTIPDNCYYFRDSIAKADIDTVKIEKGDTATSYSPYGQGSTEISKINENLFDKNNYIKIYDGQVNSSGVINTSDARHKTLLIECRPNVELSAYIKNKNNSYSRLLSCFDEEPVVGETEATATSTSPNGLHITTTSNTKYLAIYLGATFDKNWVSVQDIIDSVMLVKGNVSLTSKDYVEHKQSNYILNIQQEMLQGDYFVKEEDGWKEVHGHYKKIFDGTENIGLTSNGNSFSYTASNPYIKYNTDQTVVLNFWSNRYTKATWNDRNYSNLPNTISSYGNVIGMDKGELSTADEFKQKLTEWKNNNDPLVVFYPIGTPTKLACTEEQSAVLDELNNLNLFEGVNNIITAENIALLQAIYIANAKKYVDKEISDIKEQINTINELLSTTGTSSLLLDNLQTDLESGVM